MMTQVLIVEPDARLREIKETEMWAAGYFVIGVANEELARSGACQYPLLVLEPEVTLPLPVDTRRPHRHLNGELVPARRVRGARRATKL
jgi:hypothetical protein